MDNKKPEFWKGLEELNATPEFNKNRFREFPDKLPTDKILKDADLELTSTRRDFLKFMGFGITAATLAACTKQPVRKAVPYLFKPTDVDASVANYYATTCGGCSTGCSLLVKTKEGRPIKVEGNSLSPINKGAVCAVGQGSVLNLYDISRLQKAYSVKNETFIEWKDLDKKVIDSIKKAQAEGKQIVILSNTVNSPSIKAVIAELSNKYGAKHVQYDAVSYSAINKAHEKAFGKYIIPAYRFNKAKLVVAINADFLGTWLSPVEFTKQYSEKRRPENADEFIYHVQFETNLTITGSKADLRAVISPSQTGQLLQKLYNLIASATGNAPVGSTPNLELAGNSIKHTAEQLLKNKGESLVVASSNNPKHQMLVAGINQMLGNYGKTLDITNYSLQKQGNDEQMSTLVADMNAGSVGVLVSMGVNPAYSYPGDKFAKGAAKVGTFVSISDRVDETSKLAHYIATESHFLESWGDMNPYANVLTLSQPTITPIFQTRSALESLLAFAEIDQNAHDFIKSTWEKAAYPLQNEASNYADFWNKSVHDGIFVVPETTNSENISFNADMSEVGSMETTDANAIELYLYEKVAIREGGANTNNPWLIEMPDPISKVSWDNYASISPKLGKEKGLDNEDLIEITSNGVTLTLPVLLQPGQKHNTVAIAYGYGREVDAKYGKVMAEVGGANAFKFSTLSQGYVNNGGMKAEISGKVGTYPLALTQTHHHIESRDLVRDVTLNEFKKGDVGAPEGVAHHEMSLYKDYVFPGNHWGMAIDLSACTGCNACVISCQAENNVPVVGKDEVRRRREMHWIRIDRYYTIANNAGEHLNEYKKIDSAEVKGEIDFENVKVVFQPMLCQHCANAPCENVCPVNAINHSSEGLNQQVYNRCVGTRYCANNCPYKVRRFNWFTYTENDRFDFYMNNGLGRMVLNPDVTVRMRGVMEKCSFCVQKIQAGKLFAKKEGRPLKDGDVKTACQTTCPANAIVFGNMNDKNSEIYKLIKNKRSYAILTELNTRPVVNYMTNVRNIKIENNKA
jgi:molybdopterin-containing oxidoreductase family iron-sulfur binding subunit